MPPIAPCGLTPEGVSLPMCEVTQKSETFSLQNAALQVIIWMENFETGREVCLGGTAGPVAPGGYIWKRGRREMLCGKRMGGMQMDVKEQITKMVERISKDKGLQEQFQKEPVKALESVLGVDLPDEIVDKVIQGVKAKLTADKVSGAVDSLKGLFNLR